MVNEKWDPFGPDRHATEEQRVVLDKIVVVLEEDENLNNAYNKQLWSKLKDELRDVFKEEMYGCEWIHRGWHILLHGNKVLVKRFTWEEWNRTRALLKEIMEGPGAQGKEMPTYTPKGT